MNSGCISSCVDARAPVRVTYVNLYKWPESDAEFVKSVNNQSKAPRVVDSYSCRQLYLRSYTFSKKETVPEKTVKYFGRVKESVYGRKRTGGGDGRKSGRKCLVIRRVKEISCAAVLSIFNQLLSCTTSVDVVDHPRFNSWNKGAIGHVVFQQATRSY